MAECCLAIRSKGDVAILPLPVGLCKGGEKHLHWSLGGLTSRARYMRNFISLPGVKSQDIWVHRERRAAAEAGRISSFQGRGSQAINLGEGRSSKMPRCQTCCRNSWQLAILLPFDCTPLMHLCSADTWQLGGPRVKWTNGGFLFPEIHLGVKLPMGNQTQEISGRNGTLELKFMSCALTVSPRSSPFHLVYFNLFFILGNTTLTPLTISSKVWSDYKIND